MNCEKRILLCNQWGNAHAVAIREQLEANSIKTYWINPVLYPNDLKLHLDTQTQQVFLETTNCEVISVEEISVVAMQSWRYLKYLNPDEWETERYNEYESNSLLQAFYHLSKEQCYWLNDLAAEQKAALKPVQLNAAQKLGFPVPASIIGNNPDAVEAFVASHAVVALKPLHQSGIATQNTEQVERDEYTSFRFLTQQFTPESIKPVLPHFANCPAIVQEYIPKQLELRITVIGDKIFACAIDSQASEKSAIDWRNYDLDNTPYSIYELPKEIETKCFALFKALQLDIGAIDMILTPDGEYVFLEINPSFAWLWIEKLTGLPITDALVSFIAEKHMLYSH